MHGRDQQEQGQTRELPRQRSLASPTPGQRPEARVAPQVRPGWYRDPAGSSALRWHDGRGWTGRTRAHTYPDAAERVAPSGRIARTLAESLQWELPPAPAQPIELRSPNLPVAWAAPAAAPAPARADEALEWGSISTPRHWLPGVGAGLAAAAVLGSGAFALMASGVAALCVMVWGAQLRRALVWRRAQRGLSRLGSATCPAHASVVWLRTRQIGWQLGVLAVWEGQLAFFDARGALRWVRDTPTISAAGLGESATLHVGAVGGAGRVRAHLLGSPQSSLHASHWRALLLTHARHARCATSLIPRAHAALALALPEGRALESGHCLELTSGPAGQPAPSSARDT